MYVIEFQRLHMDPGGQITEKIIHVSILQPFKGAKYVKLPDPGYPRRQEPPLPPCYARAEFTCKIFALHWSLRVWQLGSFQILHNQDIGLFLTHSTCDQLSLVKQLINML
jgi:hypothetical protein